MIILNMHKICKKMNTNKMAAGNTHNFDATNQTLPRLQHNNYSTYHRSKCTTFNILWFITQSGSRARVNSTLTSADSECCTSSHVTHLPPWQCQSIAQFPSIKFFLIPKCDLDLDCCPLTLAWDMNPWPWICPWTSITWINHSYLLLSKIPTDIISISNPSIYTSAQPHVLVTLIITRGHLSH